MVLWNWDIVIKRKHLLTPGGRQRGQRLEGLERSHIMYSPPLIIRRVNGMMSPYGRDRTTLLAFRGGSSAVLDQTWFIYKAKMSCPTRQSPPGPRGLSGTVIPGGAGSEPVSRGTRRGLRHASLHLVVPGQPPPAPDAPLSVTAGAFQAPVPRALGELTPELSPTTLNARRSLKRLSGSNWRQEKRDRLRRLCREAEEQNKRKGLVPPGGLKHSACHSTC